MSCCDSQLNPCKSLLIMWLIHHIPIIIPLLFWYNFIIPLWFHSYLIIPLLSNYYPIISHHDYSINMSRPVTSDVIQPMLLEHNSGGIRCCAVTSRVVKRHRTPKGRHSADRPRGNPTSVAMWLWPTVSGKNGETMKKPIHIIWIL